MKNIKPGYSMKQFGKEAAQGHDPIGLLKGYVRDAQTTLQHDDLTGPDAYENLIYDLECANAIAKALAKQG